MVFMLLSSIEDKETINEVKELQECIEHLGLPVSAKEALGAKKAKKSVEKSPEN